jgi:lipid-binding SYLF domain-containing protein
LVLIFKHRETLENIGNGTFTLGGDISATAGPVGRSGSATTDYKFEAEVYSYSRSKGLFAGISLAGSAITVDADANGEFYENNPTTEDILKDDESDNTQVIALKNELEKLVKKADER